MRTTRPPPARPPRGAAARPPAAADPEPPRKRPRDPETERQRTAASLHYHSYVQRMARRTARRLHARLDLEDLVAAGYVGLMESMDRCDPRRTDTLRSFAEFRIKGAILDAARRADRLTRELRSTVDEARRVRGRLLRRYGRPATTEEVAQEMGCDLERFYEIQARVRELRPLRLREGRLDAAPYYEGMCCPAEQAAYGELRDRLRQALSRLPQRLRSVVVLLYFDDLTMETVGRLLSVTESRVCQMKYAALQLLREELHDLAPP